MSGKVDGIGIKVSTTNGAACDTTTIDRSRRQCRGIIDTICRSLDLTVKAFALLVCCLLLTLKRQANDDTRHKQTLYQTLNVAQTATSAEIKAAHRRLAIKYHPDKLLASGDAIDTAAANDSFIAIQAAYEVLSDPVERSRYDSALSSYSPFVRRPLSAPDAAARYVRRRPTAFFTGAAADGPACRTASAASSTTATPPPSSHSAVSAPSSPATPTAFHIPTNVQRSSTQRSSPRRPPTPTATPPLTSSSSFSRTAPLSPLNDTRGTFGFGIIQTIQWIITVVMIVTAPIQWAVLTVTALQENIKQRRSSAAVIPARAAQQISQRTKNQPLSSESCSSVA